MSRPICEFRAEARRNGATYYFNGNPCKRGHVALRSTAAGYCTECQAELQSAYYERHKSRLLVGCKEDRTRRRAHDPEAFKSQNTRRNREFYRLNPHLRHASNTRRRAAKLSATVFWGAELTDFVEQEAARLIYLRNASTSIRWSLDHLYPLQGAEICGLHVWNNFQVIPASLNSSKSNRMVLTCAGDWLQRL